VCPGAQLTAPDGGLTYGRDVHQPTSCGPRAARGGRSHDDESGFGCARHNRACGARALPWGVSGHAGDAKAVRRALRLGKSACVLQPAVLHHHPGRAGCAFRGVCSPFVRARPAAASRALRSFRARSCARHATTRATHRPASLIPRPLAGPATCTAGRVPVSPDSLHV
jgi:hypothetical protein